MFSRLTARKEGLNRFEWIGWWQILVATVIATYYMVIIAWTISYTLIGFKGGWGTDTQSFFFDDFLKMSDSPLNLGGMNFPVLGALAFVWGLGCYILYSGVSRGIEKANKIFMPALVVLILFLTVRSVTLRGAVTGQECQILPYFICPGCFCRFQHSPG